MLNDCARGNEAETGDGSACVDEIPWALEGIANVLDFGRMTAAVGLGGCFIWQVGSVNISLGCDIGHLLDIILKYCMD